MTHWAIVAILLAAPGAAQEDSQETVVSEDITIRGKALPGPAVAAPPVKAEKPLIDEVIHSLGVYQREQNTSAPKLLLKGTPKHFSRIFPEPPFLVFSPVAIKTSYKRWKFEVFTPKETLWKTEGSGALADRIEWDGTDGAGRFVARIGVPYSFRFTVIQENGDETTVASEPLQLMSLYYRQDLGGMRMEVANAVIFEPGTAALRESGIAYLQQVTAKLRQTKPGRKPYKISLYQQDADSKLALDRAEVIRNFVSTELLVNQNRITVDLFGIMERGDVTVCEIPMETNRGIGR